MKNTVILKNILLTFFITTIFIIPQNIHAQQNVPADPAKRILHEFDQLERQIGVHINSAVSGARNLDAMNRGLDEFMREHPAVKRILRTNNGGFTVNDVAADSPPAPPRSLANQKWLQILTQSKTPYYSSDTDSQGAVSLFYAWPLLTGPDGSHFSGAFAARIDLTTHIALIEEIAPFQLAHNGTAFLQHEWDEADYNEEPLAIKGVENLTIRTVKPVSTRQTARRQAVLPDSAAVSSSVDTAPQTPAYQPAAAVDLQESGNVKKSKKSSVLLKSLFQIFILFIILVIAVMAAVVIYRTKNRTVYTYDESLFTLDSDTDEKQAAQTAGASTQPFMNIPSLKEPASSENRSSKESVSKVMPVIDNVDDDHLPPQPIVEERVKTQESESDSSKNAKAQKAEDRSQAERDAALFKFLKSEFTKMDNKVKTLSDRIEKLEKGRA